MQESSLIEERQFKDMIGVLLSLTSKLRVQIGRASGRERVYVLV